MDDETLRLTRANYNGYCERAGWKSLVTGDPLPPFEDLPLVIREAWEAGTTAVETLIRAGYTN